MESVNDMVNLLRMVEDLQAAVFEMQRKLNINSFNSSVTGRSLDLSELFKALALAQADMEMAAKDSANPFFKSKYADLASVIKASRPALTKHGLSVVQQLLPSDDGRSSMHTILGHTSGQWIESVVRIAPAKDDIQSYGSYLTYVARYAYARLVCVSIGDDDDGEAAMQVSREPNLTSEQLADIQGDIKAATNSKALYTSILNLYKVRDLGDIKASKFQSVKTYLAAHKE